MATRACGPLSPVSRSAARTYSLSVRRDITRGSRWIGALVAALAALAVMAGHARAAGFQLGLQDPGFGAPAGSQSAQSAALAMRAINGSVVRVGVDWASVAPDTTKMPSGFEASNPADPHYHWSAIDAAVRSAAQLHARVILTLSDAPQWAEGPNRPAPTNPPTIYPGAWDPNPGAFAQFAHAAATRYGGSFRDPLNPRATLPRVSYWEIWNEENLPVYLAGPDTVGEYRALLDAGYGAIKAIHGDNLIVFGGLAPVSYLPPLSTAPLQFAAQVMCMHRVGTRFRANGSCPQPAEFDVFAIHPYSLAATPTKHAYAYDDVLVGDMGKIKTLVTTADRLHTVAPRIHHPIWVTEFAWFTNPPDTLVGDSPRVAARYVAYSMYEMWRSGVSLVIWFTARDTNSGDRLGGGLYTVSGAPKPDLRAYAFPFVAVVHRRSGFAWGRVPVSRRVKVWVERASGRHWRVVAVARTGASGVFEARFRARGNGRYRAVAAHGPVSLAYNSRRIPPRRTHLFNTG